MSQGVLAGSAGDPPTAGVQPSNSRANGDLLVEALTAGDWQRIAELVEQYADFRPGGTDASIAMAERLGATRIATLDRRHFRTVLLAHCDAFEIVP